MLAKLNIGLKISIEIPAYTTGKLLFNAGLAIATNNCAISTQKKRCSLSFLAFSDAESSKLVLRPLLVYILIA